MQGVFHVASGERGERTRELLSQLAKNVQITSPCFSKVEGTPGGHGKMLLIAVLVSVTPKK